MKAPKLPGLRRRAAIIFLACLAAGAASAFAMAPVNFWPALFAGMSVLYISIYNADSARGAFACGWLFGFGYFVIGLYWIGNALLVEGNPYAWARPLAMVGLPFLLAFFPAFACAAARRFSRQEEWQKFFSFVGCVALAEWLRGHIFTGFPWNLYGYTWADFNSLLQILSFSNVYFLTLLTVFWAALPGYLYTARHAGRRRFILPAAGIVLFLCCFTYGQIRLSQAKPAFHKDVEIVLVQPNIDQAEKWEPSLMLNHFLKHVALSRPSREKSATTTYIVWPETALSYRMMNHPYTKGLIQEMLSAWPKAYLLTGMLRYTPETETYYNSLVLIDKNAQIVGSYDKAHLVPFGEYIPFQKWIPLRPVVEFSGFAAGHGPASLKTPDGLVYSPLICYEAIFPGAVTDRSIPADMMVNVTNDGWYGVSPGPYQHFESARFRAIEEGKPLIRVANTGFSALIDPYGRTAWKSGLYEEAVITEALPLSLNLPRPAVHLENLIYVILCCSFFVLGCMVRKTKLKL